MKKIRGMGLSICVLLLFFIFSAKGSHIRFDSMINMKDGASSLEMFVDELPDIPRLRGYISKDGVLKPGRLRIGMFETKWKFHRDLPASTVFAYGRSRETATVPGPTIEAIQGADTYVTWENHLPSRHILPWDPSLSVAKPKYGGIPTVVHLHGGIVEPASDGNSMAWFTAGFNETGPTWKTAKYHYVNVQHPGNLWYHDHALGLTRVNILAGLMGAYIIFNPTVEDPLNLPSGAEYDRSLLIFDKSFTKNGSIYMNSTGDDPMMHPQWQVGTLTQRSSKGERCCRASPMVCRYTSLRKDFCLDPSSVRPISQGAALYAPCCHPPQNSYNISDLIPPPSSLIEFNAGKRVSGFETIYNNSGFHLRSLRFQVENVYYDLGVAFDCVLSNRTALNMAGILGLQYIWHMFGLCPIQRTPAKHVSDTCLHSVLCKRVMWPIKTHFPFH